MSEKDPAPSWGFRPCESAREGMLQQVLQNHLKMKKMLDCKMFVSTWCFLLANQKQMWAPKASTE